MTSSLVIGGDIGGTGTRMGLFSATDGPERPLLTKKYRSREYSGLEEILRDFLLAVEQPVAGASFGVAGPVRGRKATITNLPWIIDADALEQTLAESGSPAPVALLNDLEAMAYAVPHLHQSGGTMDENTGSGSLHVVKKGEPEENGVIALVAPGTGLGEVFLTWNGERYIAHRSEGGHTEFGPRNATQLALLEYLMQRFDHVSYERVCSGIGIPHLYDFLRDTGRAPANESLDTKIEESHDPTPRIVNAAMDEPETNPLCVAAVELFVDILGAEAGNLALKVSSYGGVYLGGGIPPRIMPYLTDGRLLSAFGAKGRLSSMLETMPVYVITHPDTALMGVACHALRL